MQGLIDEKTGFKNDPVLDRKPMEGSKVARHTRVTRCAGDDSTDSILYPLQALQLLVSETKKESITVVKTGSDQTIGECSGNG